MLERFMVIPVGIALGSNLGDRGLELDAAIAFLARLSREGPIVEAPRMKTTPVECPPGSPTFLNSVVEIQIESNTLTARQLLSQLREFETARGRNPVAEFHSPRPIDLDIIYYGGEIIDDSGLVVPHPRAHLRHFVLKPLAQIRPDLVLPGQSRTVRELLAALG